MHEAHWRRERKLDAYRDDRLGSMLRQDYVRARCAMCARRTADGADGSSDRQQVEHACGERRGLIGEEPPLPACVRYRILQQRIASSDITLKFVPDCENASDVLTKWVDKGKFERCVAYLAGERATP